MSDRIEIRGLQVAAKVGVPDLERGTPQKLDINLSLAGNFGNLGDELSRTTDYAEVSDWIRKECARSEFRLIESLADHLATALLAEFPLVTAAGVEIEKVIVPGTRNVAVSVERRRPQ